MNYNDYYSKKHLHMARDEAENNGPGAAPRRPNTRRRFDPAFGSGSESQSSVDNAGSAGKTDRTEKAENADRKTDRIDKTDAADVVESADSGRDWRNGSGESERRRQRAAGRNTYKKSDRKADKKSGRLNGGRGRSSGAVGGGKPAKIGRVMLGIISGLMCSFIVLAACAGFYGIWCYSQGMPGDVNVKASVCMYCTAVLLGSIWGTAAVRGRSKAPVLWIVGVFMVLSLAGSWQMFGWASMKPGMIVIKLLMTVLAAFVGWVIGGVPYLLRRKR